MDFYLEVFEQQDPCQDLLDLQILLVSFAIKKTSEFASCFDTAEDVCMMKISTRSSYVVTFRSLARPLYSLANALSRICPVFSHPPLPSPKQPTEIYKESPKEGPMAMLPEELVETILRHVMDDRDLPAHFKVSKLRVCKLWYRIGTPFIWNDIKLDEDNLYRLATSNINHSTLRLIKSITIAPDIRQIWYYQSVKYVYKSTELEDLFQCNLTDGLLHLTNKLPRMINLVTFSLTLANAPLPSKRSRIAIDPLVLQNLLSKMPDSLQNLELDTQAYERTNVRDQEWCICQGIQALLPRLKNIRLCLASMCPYLFTRSNSIESIVIDIASEQECVSVLCHTAPDRCTTSLDRFERWQQGMLLRCTLLDFGPQFITKATCPQLKTFLIIDRDTSHHVYVKHDILAKQSTSYPIFCPNGPRYGTFFQTSPGMLIVRAGDPRLTQVPDLYATSSAITSCLSGHPWIEDHKGTRHPVAACRERRTKELVWQDPAIFGITSNARNLRHKYGTPLDRVEEADSKVRPCTLALGQSCDGYCMTR